MVDLKWRTNEKLEKLLIIYPLDEDIRWDGCFGGQGFLLFYKTDPPKAMGNLFLVN